MRRVPGPLLLANAAPAVRLAYALLLTVAFACAPPTPQTGCRLDTECASGRCLAGVCVAEDVQIGADSAADGASADTLDAAEAAGDAASDLAEDDAATDADTAVAVEVSVDATADVSAPCQNDGECAAWLGKLDACLTAHCASGTCVALPVPDSLACATVAICPEPGVCTSGACKSVGKPCDDGEACTVD